MTIACLVLCRVVSRLFCLVPNLIPKALTLLLTYPNPNPSPYPSPNPDLNLNSNPYPKPNPNHNPPLFFSRNGTDAKTGNGTRIFVTGKKGTEGRDIAMLNVLKHSGYS